MKKICVIGQFPPPINGLTKALSTFCHNERIQNKYQIQRVDISNNKQIIKHLQTLRKMDADVFYFAIAQSTLGNLRDMMVLKTLLRRKKKIIIHLHGGYYKQLYATFNSFQKKINQKLMSQVNIVIVLGEGLKNLFEDVIDLKKVRVCENFIEDESFLEEALFEKKMNEIINADRNLKVLYLSNFNEGKGYKDVLKAAKLVKDEPIEFHFAGAFDQNEQEFFDYIKKNRLEEKVTYHGIVKGDEKKLLFLENDIFILPTYYQKEGQPISIIEAMGNGLSVITTNHAGIPDIVTEKNGFIVNKKVPNEIAEKLVELVKNKSKLTEYGYYNRAYALQNFKESDYIERLQLIFDEVLADENRIG